MDNPIRVVAKLIVTTLLVLIPAEGHAAPPDLCDEPVRTVDGGLYEDSTGLTISRWCEPHTDPPVWGRSVCCSITDEAYCEPATTAGRCMTGTTRFGCEFGEQIGEQVVCYQPGPGACEQGFCIDYERGGPEVFVATIWECCVPIVNDVVCHFAGSTNNGAPPDTDCGGFFSICQWGQSNLDGTTSCFG